MERLKDHRNIVKLLYTVKGENNSCRVILSCFHKQNALISSPVLRFYSNYIGLELCVASSEKLVVKPDGAKRYNGPPIPHDFNISPSN